ncbi:MAG: helix-turn-helix domain-containing protein [Bacteroidota bacterium]
MRKSTSIPRIIKINKIEDFTIYCAFNTGEYRIIDFKPLFEKWEIEKSAFQSKLLDPKEFAQVSINEGTLQWPNITQEMTLSNSMTFTTMYDLDPLVLYEESISDEEMNQRYQVGELLRKARKEAGLTQEELAKRSGTTKNYISRIENNRSDLEVRTLIKIIEIGLGKKLQLQID